MRDATKEIRKTFFTALTGQIAGVSLFDGKIEGVGSLAGDKWILFGDQTSTDRSNKHQYVTEESIELIIVEKTAGSAGRDTVENIADAVLQIVLPDYPHESTLSIAEPFTIVFIRLADSRADRVDETINRLFKNKKILHFIIRVTQN